MEKTKLQTMIDAKSPSIIFRCCLDEKGYSTEPDDLEMKQISDRIGESMIKVQAESLRNFIDAVCLNGQTFIPSTFKSRIMMNNENFEQTQLFVLEFNNMHDNKIISFEDIKQRAEHYALPIFFAYETFFSIDQNRFSVVFLHNMPILGFRVAKIILEVFFTIFPEADSDSFCKVTQMCYGGTKGVLYLDEALPKFDMVILGNALSAYYKDEDKNKGKNKGKK